MTLPDCDTLFVKFFSPWYQEDERPFLTREDMYKIAGYSGEPLDFDDVQYLAPESLDYQKKMINQTMAEAALGDFSSITGTDIFDLNALHAIDQYYDRPKIDELIQESNPKSFSNPYLVTVCELGVMLGQLFRQIDGFDWLYADPYFHSIIVHRDTGFGITVFDWALKKFSEYGVDDGMAAKFLTALEITEQR